MPGLSVRLSALDLPRTTIQNCIINLIRNTFRYASRKYWDQISHDLRPVYTAPTRAVAAAEHELGVFLDKWGRLNPPIVGLWRDDGRSSPRSSPTTWRSAGCCAQQTPSSR